MHKWTIHTHVLAFVTKYATHLINILMHIYIKQDFPLRGAASAKTRDDRYMGIGMTAY